MGRAFEVRSQLGAISVDGGYGIPNCVPVIEENRLTFPRGTPEGTRFNLVGLGLGIVSGETTTFQNQEYLVAYYLIARGERIIGKIPLGLYPEMGQRLLKTCANYMEINLAKLLEALKDNSKLAEELGARPLNTKVVSLLASSQIAVPA